MGIESNKWGRNNLGPAEDPQAEAYLQELIAKYPTPESIVDDYRHDGISQLAMPRRFPDPDDQKEIRQLAEERNAADKENQNAERKEFQEKYVMPIMEVARELDSEAIKLMVGDDDWEIHEFDAKLEVESNKRADGEALTKMLEALRQMVNLQENENPSNKEKMQELADEFNGLRYP